MELPDKTIDSISVTWMIKHLTEEDVIDFRRGKIARYKVPKYIFFVNEYPMTASGKIQKYKLREMSLQLLKEKGNRPIPPREMRTVNKKITKILIF